MRKSVIILLGVLFFVSLVSAVSYDMPEWKDKYVNDFGGVLSEGQVNELKSLLKGVEENTSAELVFVSVSECAPFAPSQYANELFNKWGIGKSDKDNGLLALYCKTENKIWVETGYGLEGILPDSKLGALLDEYYVPLRDSGNVSEGVILFVENVARIINENREEVLSGNAGGKGFSEWKWEVILLSIFVLIFVIILPIINLVKQAKSKNKRLDYEEVRHGKSSYGIKENKLMSHVGLITIILFIGFLFLGYVIAGFLVFVIGFFVLGLLIKLLIGVRCEKDGLRMRKIGKRGNHVYYKCPHGHTGWVLAGAAAGALIGHGLGGGFGGGGFGGGGGGGFGGGGSGGGGAGR